MDETNDARGEKKISTGGRRLRFNGNRRGGGRRGGCHMEAEWERGGVVWSSAAAWRRRGNGPAVALAGGALPCDSGERRGRRDAGRCG
jgi:hypothetical protein